MGGVGAVISPPVRKFSKSISQALPRPPAWIAGRLLSRSRRRTVLNDQPVIAANWLGEAKRRWSIRNSKECILGVLKQTTAGNCQCDVRADSLAIQKIWETPNLTQE